MTSNYVQWILKLINKNNIQYLDATIYNIK